MKALALLFSVYLLFLFAAPVLAQLPVKSHSCCNGKHANGHNNNSGCCPVNGMCTPFSGCGCYLGVNVPPAGIKVAAPPRCINFSQSVVQGKLISDYLADCFHPPEMA